MALGANYITLAELKSRLNISDATDDNRLTDAIVAASREVERHCRRQFNDAGSSSMREFDLYPSDIITDDFSALTSIVLVDENGTTTQTLTAGQYTLRPRNGFVNGVGGWPAWSITNKPGLADWSGVSAQVTARWGWAAVPGPVRESTFLLAIEIYKLKEAPFGVQNWGDFGPVRIADNKRVKGLLRHYRRGMMVA